MAHHDKVIMMAYKKSSVKKTVSTSVSAKPGTPMFPGKWELNNGVWTKNRDFFHQRLDRFMKKNSNSFVIGRDFKDDRQRFDIYVNVTSLSPRDAWDARLSNLGSITFMSERDHRLLKTKEKSSERTNANIYKNGRCILDFFFNHVSGHICFKVRSRLETILVPAFTASGPGSDINVNVSRQLEAFNQLQHNVVFCIGRFLRTINASKFCNDVPIEFAFKKAVVKKKVVVPKKTVKTTRQKTSKTAESSLVPLTTTIKGLTEFIDTFRSQSHMGHYNGIKRSTRVPNGECYHLAVGESRRLPVRDASYKRRDVFYGIIASRNDDIMVYRYVLYLDSKTNPMPRKQEFIVTIFSGKISGQMINPLICRVV
jgi:hypothetical protein